MKPAHPYKYILLNGITHKVKIDIDVVDLVTALNDLGCYTEQSCQDNVDGRVWISFAQAASAEYFLILIAHQSDNLRGCVLGATTESYDKHPNAWEHKDRWWVDAFVNSAPWRNNVRKEVIINVCVRFPREHLEEVTAIVVKLSNKET